MEHRWEALRRLARRMETDLYFKEASAINDLDAHRMMLLREELQDLIDALQLLETMQAHTKLVKIMIGLALTQVATLLLSVWAVLQ